MFNNIKFDRAGNLLVTGASVGSGSGFDIVTAKYDTAGNRLWLTRWNGSASTEDWPYGMAVDSDNNVIVAGYYNNGAGWVILKYDSGGTRKWDRYPSSNTARAVAVDLAGNIYATGSTWRPYYGWEVLTLKYTASGVPVWRHTYNAAGNGGDGGRAIAVDNSGFVYVAGVDVPDNRADCVVLKYVQKTDVELKRLLAPLGRIAPGTVVTPACSVSNNGGSAVTYQVRMRIGSSYDQTVTVTAQPPISTRRVTFPNWTANPPGSWAVSCSTVLAADYNHANDKATGRVAVASGSGPAVTEVWPDNGGNNGSIQVGIAGENFDPDTRGCVEVRLRKSGVPDLSFVAAVVNSRYAVGTLNLRDAETGLYDLVLRDGTGDSTVANSAFLVQSVRRSAVCQVVGQPTIRRGRVVTYRLTFVNAGNVDYEDPCMLLICPAFLHILALTDEAGNNISWDRLNIGNNLANGLANYPQFWQGADSGLCTLALKPPVLTRGKLLRGCKVIVDMTVEAVFDGIGWIGFRALVREAAAPPSPDGGTTVLHALHHRAFGNEPWCPRSNDSLDVLWRQAYDGAVWMMGDSTSVMMPPNRGGREPVSVPLRPASDFMGQFYSRLMQPDSGRFRGFFNAHTGGRALPGRPDPVTGTRRQVEGNGLPAMVPHWPMTSAFYNLGHQMVQIAKEHCDTLPNPELDLGEVVLLQDPPGAIEHIAVVSSWDPNDKYGASGSDTLRHYVPVTERLDYTIHFENLDSATAPAETVVVTDQIDSDLNWETLVLDSVSHPLVCHAVADSNTNTITWHFDDINLPPNRNPPEGEGWVKFHIWPKSWRASGTEVKNAATIVFDNNAPMTTDTVLNTLDAGWPSSSVRPMPDTTASAQVTVRWNGSDEAQGSGIGYYNVYARTGSTPWRLVFGPTRDTMGQFTAENETRYYFYSVAVDRVGHVEAAPSLPDDSTFVIGIAPPVLITPPDTLYAPGGVLADSTPQFVWTSTAGNDGTYTLQYSADSAFVSGVVTRSGLAATTYTVPDTSALRDTTWFWRVEAVGPRGAHSGYAAPRRFRVDVRPPAAPRLLLPSDGAVIDSTFTFYWSAIRGEAVDYLLCFSADSIFDPNISHGVRTGDTSYRVPDWVAFNDTTYYWVVRARDRGGNYSPLQVRPFRFTVDRQPAISGVARYYAGTNPPVPNAKLVMTGARNDTVLSDVRGSYAFTGLTRGQNYSTRPERVSPSREPAVSSFDAAMALQHSVRRDTLDSLQFRAADVSGDSTVSSFDAGLILQYAVSRIRHFPVGRRPGLDTVDWAFRPPLRSYSSLPGHQIGQDFRSILYGDPSGNWPAAEFFCAWEDPSADKRFFSANLPDEQTVSLPAGAVNAPPALNAQDDVDARGEVVFPVVVPDARGAVSADMLVRYDAEALTLTGVRTTKATTGFLVAAVEQNGLVRVGMAGTSPLRGEVPLVELHFAARIVENEYNRASRPTEVIWLVLDEGRLPESESEGAMGGRSRLPAAFFLSQPVPNPFQHGARINFGLPRSARVQLAVFDAVGRQVRTLASGPRAAGYHTVTWDGRDQRGRQLANGVYFVRLTADKQRFGRRVTLLHQ